MYSEIPSVLDTVKQNNNNKIYVVSLETTRSILNRCQDNECLECFKELQIRWSIRMQKNAKLNVSFEVSYLDLEKISTDFLHCLCGSYQ